MTGTISMLDSAYNDQFRPGFAAYAAYVDGQRGDQPNIDYIVAAFPEADHLSIALFPDKDAEALDIENGAATPGSAADWVRRQRARGVARPCLYADASEMESDVVPAVLAAGVARESVRLWSAHFTESPHICGPGSCGATSIDMDGTQWTSSAMGLVLDQSDMRDDFFSDPKPNPAPNVVEFDMSRLPVLKQGDADKPGQFWYVRRLQSLVVLAADLNGLDAAKGLTVDGSFGQKTTVAVKAVQAHWSIAADGICGIETWGVLLTGSPA